MSDRQTDRGERGRAKREGGKAERGRQRETMGKTDNQKSSRLLRTLFCYIFNLQSRPKLLMHDPLGDPQDSVLIVARYNEFETEL